MSNNKVQDLDSMRCMIEGINADDFCFALYHFSLLNISASNEYDTKYQIDLQPSETKEMAMIEARRKEYVEILKKEFHTRITYNEATDKHIVDFLQLVIDRECADKEKKEIDDKILSAIKEVLPKLQVGEYFNNLTRWVSIKTELDTAINAFYHSDIYDQSRLNQIILADREALDKFPYEILQNRCGSELGSLFDQRIKTTFYMSKMTKEERYRYVLKYVMKRMDLDKRDECLWYEILCVSFTSLHKYGF